MFTDVRAATIAVFSPRHIDTKRQPRLYWYWKAFSSLVLGTFRFTDTCLLDRFLLTSLRIGVLRFDMVGP